MASSNVNNLRKTFYQLGTPQKREFIERLSAQSGTKKLPEYAALLSECVRVYNAEMRTPKLAPAPKPAPKPAAKPAAYTGRPATTYAGRPAATGPAPIAPRRGTYMFCGACGTRVDANARFCSRCGENPSAPRPQDEPEYPSHTVYSQKPFVNYDEGSFAGRLHSIGRSPLFLVGIIIWSAGSLLGLLFNFSIFSFVTLGLLALPVTGLWLLYAASVKPAFPEKSLTSVILFKVATIIELVSAAIGLLTLVVALFFMTQILPMAVILPIIALLIAVAVVLGIYYMSLLRMYADIRQGVTRNLVKPLRGVIAFTVISCIMVGTTVTNALMAMTAGNLMAPLINALPANMRGLTQGLLQGSAMPAISLLLTMSTGAGLIICLVALNKFNNSLKA